MNRHRHYADLQVACAHCGGVFVFSAGEQELLAVRGLNRRPERCPRCVRGRRQTRR